MRHSFYNRIFGLLLITGLASGIFLFQAKSLLAESSASTPSSATSTATLVATVNIQNASFTQDGHALNISFDLENGSIPAQGVLYGIELVGSSTTQGQFVADQKIYQDSVNLPVNTSVHKDVTYTAPSSLSGTYEIVLTSENSSGFPFAIAALGAVTLEGAGGIEIDAGSCYLTISDDAAHTQYALRQGIDIAPSESLILHCTAQNEGVATTATPTYEMHYRTAYGSVVSETEGSTSPISFGTDAQKDIALTLPKATAPQAYDVLVVLGNSNPIDVHYVLQGESATIQNLTLDKDYYSKGGTATVTYIWSPSADTFAGSRYAASHMSTSSARAAPNIIASSTLTNGLGKNCAVPASVPASLTSAMPALSFSVTRDCLNPHLTLELVNASGTVLARQEISRTSPPQQGGPSLRILIAIILFVIAVIAIALGALLHFHKKSEPAAQIEERHDDQ